MSLDAKLADAKPRKTHTSEIAGTKRNQNKGNQKLQQRVLEMI
jgi:hypothetical protein